MCIYDLYFLLVSSLVRETLETRRANRPEEGPIICIKYETLKRKEIKMIKTFVSNYSQTISLSL